MLRLDVQQPSLHDLSIRDFVLLLQSFGDRAHRSDVLRLHCFLLIHGLDTHLVIGNYLVPLLVDTACLPLARNAFLRLPNPNAFSWNSLISGYVKCGKPLHALTLFACMQHNPSARPDDYTFVSALKASANLKNVCKAHEVHAGVIKGGWIEKNVVVGNALIDTYGKCKAPAKAKLVFDTLPSKNVITWTSLLGCHVECGQYQEAMSCYQAMNLQEVTPNAVTFVCILKACTNAGFVDRGQEMHAEIERRSLLDGDVFLGSALVDMYARCGLLAIAQQVFDRLPSRSVVSWNSLMSGYIEHDNGEEAVRCFSQMQSEGVCLTEISFLCGLKACESIGSEALLEDIHAEIDRRDLIERNLVVGSTLVNAYVKCGFLTRAQHVFDHLPARDVVVWTAMLTGYAQTGETKTMADLFDTMVSTGIRPDPVAFVVVLNACSRTGLSDKSETVFQAMGKEHGFLPLREHHSCTVDLLGRVGQLDEAIALLLQLPCSPNLVIWHTILGACKSLGNAQIGNWAFNQQYS